MPPATQLSAYVARAGLSLTLSLKNPMKQTGEPIERRARLLLDSPPVTGLVPQDARP